MQYVTRLIKLYFTGELVSGVEQESKFNTRSVSVYKKAKRTAYYARYNLQNWTAENAASHVTTLPMAISDVEISAVRVFAV